MNRKIALILISSLVTANAVFAEYSFVDSSDFTGDIFFKPAAFQEEQVNDNKKGYSQKGTIPPLKKLRLIVKKKMNEKQEKRTQLAPVAPQEDIYAAGTETSEYASHEIEENFEDNIMPDGFDADSVSILENENRHFWNKGLKNRKNKSEAKENLENIILDCENVDYDTDSYCVFAKGNVNVEFVKQQTFLKADIITYDRANNTIKAEGNVHILKNGQTISGDYIFVDMNEENALIENPLTQTAVIEIKSKKGYVYGDRIVQEKGSISVQNSFPVEFRSATRGPVMSKMIIPKEQTLTNDMEKGIVSIKVKDLKITEKGDLEVIAIRHAKVLRGKRTFIKIPAVKIYTNKKNDYAETNAWELGSLRGLGMYIGPGFVFELPRGSVLKAIPILNYNHRIGVGGIGRFSSSTNVTQVAYGTAKSKILIRGKQKLDDNLYIQYGMNDYMNEWFLGRRRPKYGMDLVYEKGYSSDDFLINGHSSSYAHRFDLGYYHDIDKDRNFGLLQGNRIGTMRARYMAQADQNLLKYKNEDKQTAFELDISGQLAASVYGTGDTQVIGRIGPKLHTQYKRWMQDVGYYQAVYDDNSPIPVFDAYRYGRSSLYLREYLRLHRYLTLSWFGAINLSGDSPNDRPFQENSFYISVGPDDIKFNLGYDFIRENTFFTVELMLDAKGAHIDYDKFEIKQEKKAEKRDEIKEEDNSFKNAKNPSVLKHAVVEDIKTVEDVI